MGRIEEPRVEVFTQDPGCSSSGGGCNHKAQGGCGQQLLEQEGVLPAAFFPCFLDAINHGHPKHQRANCSSTFCAAWWELVQRPLGHS